MADMVRLGVDRLFDEYGHRLEGRRVGLITNPSGVDSSLVSTIDRLDAYDGVELARLFAPEHGIRGDRQAGETVPDEVDERTGVPVRSLYGDTRRIQPEMIDDLDAVIYDMQDVGCRFYTLVYTLANAMEGCGGTDTEFVVLDRPNPIAPVGVSGNRVPDDRASFVSGRRLPIVHGLTIGELARYFDGEFDLGVDCTVVEMTGWSPDRWFDELDLPWIPPSPNVPTPETALVYPGTCLFEGTTFSEGRGTTKPFELIGAPGIDAHEWASALDEIGLEGVGFRPVSFEPTTSKHEGEIVSGLQLHVLDRDRFAPVETGIAMLLSAVRLFSDLEWIRMDGTYFLDRLAGGPWLRRAIDDHDRSRRLSKLFRELIDRWTDDVESFERCRERYARYR